MKKAIYSLFMAICIGVCLFSGYKLYGIWKESHTIRSEADRLTQYTQTHTPQEEADSEKPKEETPEKEPVKGFSVDFAKLQQENPDICGWLIVPGTGINSAVVQGTDNEFYLNHTTLKEYNTHGAMFLDVNTPRDLSSDNTLLYGHSVDVGGMFTNLDYFEDQAFFDSHPYFWYLTPDQNYKCEITAFLKTSSNSAAYNYSFGDYRDVILDTIHATALYSRDMELPADGHFLSLSTCDLDYGFHSQQRLVVYSLLTEYDEPIVLENDPQ